MIVKNFLGGSGGESANIYLTGLLSTDTVECTSPSGKSLSAVWGTYTVESVSTQCWRIVASEYGTYSITAERTGTFEKEVSCLVDVATDYTIDMSEILPSGFQEVEYIQSSGSQYIDTNYFPSNDTYLEHVLLFTSVSSGGYNGTYGTSRFHYPKYWDYKYAHFGMGDAWAPSSYSSYPFTANTEYDCIMDAPNKTASYNTNSFSVSYSNNFTCTHSLYVHALNNNGSVAQYTLMKTYSLTIREDGTLVRNFIPCYCTESKTGYKGSTATTCASGTVGLYDLVNDRFYINCGTGTDFTKGDDV